MALNMAAAAFPVEVVRSVVPILQVSALGKQVPLADGQLMILADISFKVAAGESVAIVGASGSGKSTLLGLMAGLDLPSSGSVSLQGENLQALSEDGRARLRARAVGFVFQSFQLLPALTALENVMLPLELAGRSDARTLASEWLGRVGLGQRLQHYPKQLSGGEQQRWRWRARLPVRRRCCLPTNRPAISTLLPGSR